MRLIQVRVADDVLEDVTAALDDADVDYVVSPATGTGDDAAIVSFPTPTGAVEEMLELLREAGVERDAYTIVTAIETATTPHYEELEGRYTQGPEDTVGLSGAELRTRAQELTPETPVFAVFASLSAVLATAGLLLDSAVVVTGSMVVAPFAGSLLSTSVGLVTEDVASVTENARSQLTGLVVAVLSAIGASLLFRYGYFVPPSLAVERVSQVASFSSPTLLLLTIAVVAGAAGALALSTDLPVAVAGVAVAAAIVPAAAAVGVGLVWRAPFLALGAVALLLLNITVINVSSLVTLVAFGYRPARLGRDGRLSLTVRSVVAVTGAVLVVGLVLALVFSATQYFLLGQSVNRNVEAVLAEPAYADAELVSVEYDYEGTGLVSRRGTVTVVVSHPAGREYPVLADRIHGRLAAALERPLAVRVRTVEYRESGPGATAGRSVSRPRRTRPSALVGHETRSSCAVSASRPATRLPVDAPWGQPPLL